VTACVRVTLEADVVRAGKALYVGVSEWTPEQWRAGHALAQRAEDLVRLQPAEIQTLYRVIEPEVV
jgi:aryl-alcohol dehydrogenase-like predicted oxidoreductase